ncbi:cytochrome P450 [Ornithinimicrobium panacihumi]|uniref:cytochrome P450 n=1 Tax=Ornithinimicrobium panacihumi TaxID=2008449 RepID=UPI003F8C6EC0
MTACQRKTSYPGEAGGPAIEQIDGTWHIRSLPLVREVLRTPGAVQAGFAAEMVRASATLPHMPVLYLDGPEHKKQRTAIARYFAPATVDRRYRELMEERADTLLARLDDHRPVDLSEITLHFSAQVAARVIGLTDSEQEGMAHRLVRFFDVPDAMLRSTGTVSGWRRIPATLTSLPKLAQTTAFYLRDVRPAIRARRAERQQDVISHLLDHDYSDVEIVMECITYGAAGMVTTREFLQIAVWHLLEQPDLRADFLDGDSARRSEILLEILRLEPVVGHLYRRAETELVLTDGGEEHRIPAGSRLDLYVRAANTDPDHVTPDPLALCPGRDLPKGVRAEVMSFGDGPHRCPGNAIAMTESEIFLIRILARDLELLEEPHLEWEELIAGYAVRGLLVRDTGRTWRDQAGPTERLMPAG